MRDLSLITAHDYAFAAELCEVSLRPFSAEVERQAALTSLLEGFLRTSIKAYTMFEGDCTCQNHIAWLQSETFAGHTTTLCIMCSSLLFATGQPVLT